MEVDQELALVSKDMSEDALIDLWIKGKKSEHTHRAYRRHIESFRLFLSKPIAQATLVDLYQFAEELQNHSMSPNSQKVVLDVVKSYLNFAYIAGFLRVNIGAAFKSLPGSETMSERILSEYEVQSMILNEHDTRNHVILRVLYDGGLRISELCGLTWRDVVERDNNQVQVSVMGKGGKKRFVLLSPETSVAIMAIGRGDDEEYVFQSDPSYNTTRLTARAVQYLVKNAAKRAGIKRWKEVSPHWLRHSHATHSIEHGAPLPLVRDTLGHSNIAVTNTYAHVRPGDSSSRFLPTF